MPKRKLSLMPAATDALVSLGGMIRERRLARRWTSADLAARLGVSPRTVQAIEAGRPGTSVGTVFNAAVLVGLPLFETTDRYELARLRRRGEERLGLLPARAFPLSMDAADDPDF